MGEIHVKDSGNSLREVKKVFVKDSTGTLRGPIRKAFVRDGSSVRDVFTKIETLSISVFVDLSSPIPACLTVSLTFESFEYA